MKLRTILIHDPHPTSLVVTRNMIHSRDGLRVGGESEDFDRLLVLGKNSMADMLVMEIGEFGEIAEADDAERGIANLAVFHLRFPSIPILVLSRRDETMYARMAVRMGARGYVMKHEPQARIADAVQTVLSGRVYLSRAATHHLLMGQVGVRIGIFRGFNGDVSRLSHRELAIFRLLGLGLSADRIADSLQVTIRTVYTHSSSIRKKMRLERSTNLSSLAEAWLHRTP
ncbi:LuxR C-terminal-related transcriptional regulator [Desulfonatronum thioautotrophicum]|uniref:LuxR C-terminal-related transcriptional regulator n=1 Tax=Desulfonatronum thioautotrophicum TaxID=617001 RepID=UPI0005EBE6F5|nr:response regulator transcription factor [Desulfonatronum thioautotrophicum]